MREAVEAFEGEAQEVLLGGVGGKIAGTREVVGAVHVAADGLFAADFGRIHRFECGAYAAEVVVAYGDEKIAGAATATIAFGEVPQLTMADEATTTITIDCGDGVALGTTADAATEFWVVIPETTFEGGITITVTDAEGGAFEKSTTKEVVIERNAVQPMAALEVEYKLPSPTNNEIWYTNGSTTDATKPDNTEAFGANIISNTYDAEKKCWVIRFNGEVTTIGGYAFYFCENLTSVIIPDSVTYIGNEAFYRCSSLTSVTIGNGVAIIGDAAFSGCSSLTSVTIPDSVRMIYDNAFFGCSSLTSVTIGNNVRMIYNNAFRNCSSLTSVTITDSVNTIENGAFSGCSSLQEFKGKFASTDHRCLIIDGVINSFAIGCGATEYTIPDSVTEIGSSAFSDCSSLTRVIIPASVTEVGASAFRNCSSLTSITIPDSVTEIGSSAFNGCTSLTSVYCKAATPPSNSGVFDNNASGRKIYVPAESIEAYLTSWSVYSDAIVAYDFDNCEIVPTPATYVWYTATAKVVPSNKNVFGAIYQSSEWDSETGEGVITFYGEVTSIGASAFRDCSNLTSVTIPDNVTTIGKYAFEDCGSLTSVTIPDNVTTIGEYAFEYCGSLTSVTIPNSVTTIGEGAFKGCKGELIINSKIIETNYTSSNYPSKGWLRGAEFTSLTIGDSVNSIGNWVFWGCESLTSVTIGNNVTSIGSQAFEECCSLTSVTIGNSVTSIGNAAFEDCSSLTSVTIPDNVTTIGKYAFCYCENLTSVTIPNSVTKIEDFVFSSCSSLTSVTIPDSVTKIGKYAFQSCSSLTSVTIPDSVNTIGIDAFYYCKNLTSVYCNAIIPPSLDNIGVFFDNASGRKIYVPTEAVDVYKAATYWSEYRSYIVGYDF